MRPWLAGAALSPRRGGPCPPEAVSAVLAKPPVGGAQGPQDWLGPYPSGRRGSGHPRAPHPPPPWSCCWPLPPITRRRRCAPRASLPDPPRLDPSLVALQAWPRRPQLEPSSPAIQAHHRIPAQPAAGVTPGLSRVWGRTHTFSRIWNSRLSVSSGCSADLEVVLGGASLGLPFRVWASGLLKLVSLPTRRAPAAPLTTYGCFCSRDSCLFLSLEIQRHTFPTLRAPLGAGRSPHRLSLWVTGPGALGSGTSFRWRLNHPSPVCGPGGHGGPGPLRRPPQRPPR